MIIFRSDNFLTALQLSQNENAIKLHDLIRAEPERWQNVVQGISEKIADGDGAIDKKYCTYLFYVSGMSSAVMDALDALDDGVYGVVMSKAVRTIGESPFAVGGEI